VSGLLLIAEQRLEGFGLHFEHLVDELHDEVALGGVGVNGLDDEVALGRVTAMVVLDRMAIIRSRSAGGTTASSWMTCDFSLSRCAEALPINFATRMTGATVKDDMTFITARSMSTSSPLAARTAA
jgi:hypothetical protein